MVSSPHLLQFSRGWFYILNILLRFGFNLLMTWVPSRFREGDQLLYIILSSVMATSDLGTLSAPRGCSNVVFILTNKDA